MTPQDISKMAEEILQKHLQDKVDEFFTGYELKSILAAMQEYAALTFHASGIDTLRQWMAIGDNITTAAENVVGLMIDDDHHGATYKELVASVENFICTEMFKGYVSAETPLPTVEERMEYTGKAFDAGYKNGWNVSAFGDSNGYPNREEYLKSIKKDWYEKETKRV